MVWIIAAILTYPGQLTRNRAELQQKNVLQKFTSFLKNYWCCLDDLSLYATLNLVSNVLAQTQRIYKLTLFIKLVVSFLKIPNEPVATRRVGI